MTFTKCILSALLAVQATQAGTIAVIFYDNRFGTINDGTGAFTQVGTLPVSASSGIANDNGTLYVENMGQDLYTVDPVTGASALIGPTGLATTAGAFAGALNGLFEVDYASNLFSINPLTGKGTLIGATGLAANNGGEDTSLSDDGTSLLYTAGAAGHTDELYRINLVTGVATDLGSTGVTGIAGSAFVNGNLELFQYGQSTDYIYTAPDGSTNFTRGAVLGAQIIDGGVSTGLTTQTTSNSVPSTPEPGSLLLMISGLIIGGVAALRRHRKVGRIPVRT